MHIMFGLKKKAAQQGECDISCSSSLINNWKSVVVSFLEVWLTSAVAVRPPVLAEGERVCGNPMGRLFQVSSAKFKWLGPSPAPQMGSVAAGLPTTREL